MRLIVKPNRHALIFATALVLCRTCSAASLPSPEILLTSLTLFSCEPRVTTDVCNLDNMGGSGIDFQHRGSELNDGKFAKAWNDEECCRKCQETPGCKSWSRFRARDQYNSQNDCWLKSSIPDTAENKDLTSGVVAPVVLNAKPCKALEMVGFKNAIPYNNPELLHASNPATCCSWCQADNELCYAWSWSNFDHHCRLYGTPVEEQDHYLSRGFVSGIQKADRGRIKSIKQCADGGKEHVHYQGAKAPVVIAQKQSFKTVTSIECCGLCEATRECKSWSWNKDFSCYLNGAIPEPQWDFDYWGGVASMKVCNPNSCEIVNQIKIHGSDLDETQPLAPAGSSFIVSSPEECCERCQEYPECILWSFSQGSIRESYCSMKSRLPPDVGLRTSFELVSGDQVAFSGYVTSRLSPDEIENFLRGVRYAKNEGGHAEGEESISVKKSAGPSLMVILPISVLGGIVCCFLVMAVAAYSRSNRRKKLINEARESTISEAKAIKEHCSQRSTLSSALGTMVLSEKSHSMCTHPRLGTDASLTSESGDWSAPQLELIEPREDLSMRLDRIKESLLTRGRSFKGLLSFQSVSEQTSIIVEVGTIVGGKYKIEPGARQGENSHILNAAQVFGHGVPVVLKFYHHVHAFQAERNFFSQRLATNSFIPQVFDVFEAETMNSWGLPDFPCIVVERGEQTLTEWLRQCTRTLDTMDQRGILYKICCAVQSLHDCGVVHRDLKPDNIVLFSSSFTWKLIDFGSWGKRNRREAIQYSLHYAPPEIIAAHASNEHSIIVKPASDMWSLGLIFWEILTGEALFDMDFSEEQVLSALVGAEPLPFEKEPKLWAKIEESSARRLVAHLLQRNPDARWTIRKVINNAYFSPGSDTIQVENSRERVSGMLCTIAESIQRVEGRVLQATEIAFENLKHTVGNVLLMCFSFYEISDEGAPPTLPDDDIVRAHMEGTLPCTQALLEPKYNVFKRAANDPVTLLRLEKKHLLKITIMYGADVMMELPISDILFCRLYPIDAEEDSQEVTMFPQYDNSPAGTARHSIGVWDTLRHEDIALRLVGKTTVVIVVGFRLLGSDSVVEVRKSLEISMHPPDEPFRLVKMFYRTQEWYSNLPDWAKIYIHGAVSVVKLSSNVL